jgi:hypothetical protein
MARGVRRIGGLASLTVNRVVWGQAHVRAGDGVVGTGA